MNEKEINVVDLDKPNIKNNDNKENVDFKKNKKVFATLGFVLGIVGLATSIIGGIGLLLNIPGLIFSKLGLKSIAKKHQAKKGVKLNIIGIVINAICVAITFVIWIAIMVEIMDKML